MIPTVLQWYGFCVLKLTNFSSTDLIFEKFNKIGEKNNKTIVQQRDIKHKKEQNNFEAGEYNDWTKNMQQRGIGSDPIK